MSKEELVRFLDSLFPAFRESWKEDSFYGSGYESFTAHAAMSYFTHYYLTHYTRFDDETLESFCRGIEEVVASDPDDQSDVANAICTCFLENIAGDDEARRLEPHLGRACREYYANWLWVRKGREPI